MSKKVMILWSGGVDSTATLKMYLEKTDYQIYALKINYKTTGTVTSSRIKKEVKAINTLLPILQNIRPFNFSEVVVNMPNIVAGSDIPIFSTIALYPAYSYGCKEIVIGWVADMRSEQIKYVEAKHRDLNKISYLMQKNSLGWWKWYPKFVLNQFFDTKKNYLLALGELAQHVWFCRNVKLAGNTQGCGICTPCIHIKKISDKLIEL
jgi:7-cyano-7-deazaguanine synthase in queuosine biosynthesis